MNNNFLDSKENILKGVSSIINLNKREKNTKLKFESSSNQINKEFYKKKSFSNNDIYNISTKNSKKSIIPYKNASNSNKNIVFFKGKSKKNILIFDENGFLKKSQKHVPQESENKSIFSNNMILSKKSSKRASIRTIESRDSFEFNFETNNNNLNLITNIKSQNNKSNSKQPYKFLISLFKNKSKIKELTESKNFRSSFHKSVKNDIKSSIEIKKFSKKTLNNNTISHSKNSNSIYENNNQSIFNNRMSIDINKYSKSDFSHFHNDMRRSNYNKYKLKSSLDNSSNVNGKQIRIPIIKKLGELNKYMLRGNNNPDILNALVKEKILDSIFFKNTENAEGNRLSKRLSHLSLSSNSDYNMIRKRENINYNHIKESVKNKTLSTIKLLNDISIEYDFSNNNLNTESCQIPIIIMKSKNIKRVQRYRKIISDGYDFENDPIGLDNLKSLKNLICKNERESKIGLKYLKLDVPKFIKKKFKSTTNSYFNHININ